MKRNSTGFTRLRGLGAYSVSDPGSFPGGISSVAQPYAENVVFNGGGRKSAPAGILAPVPGAPPYMPNVGRYTLPIINDTLLTANVSKVILNANPGRVYFFIQNLGPGNLRLRFNDSTALPTNSLTLVANQFLEYLGGPPGQGVFIPQDSVAVSADTANTQYVYGEGQIVGI